MATPTTSSLLPITSLNTAPTQAFLSTIELLFEPAPPLAAALLARRPFESYTHLLDSTWEIMQSLKEDEQMEVIDAHPRIGKYRYLLLTYDLEGLMCNVGAPKQTLSKMSFIEQGYNNAAQPSQQQPTTPASEDDSLNALLKTLNEEYEAKFGFKFVVFVAGRPRSMIPDIIRQRMGNSKAEEMKTGMKAMVDIARDRLKKLETGVVRL
ncbi:hypothetical protein HDV05_000380 [Chytridiales sp. JEL 0842]|nr:hypothetical protein HDV05_000380 [Chytridiales sp. JEL 0842]